MVELRCLNWHSHPAPTKGCCEGCMMCCGYTTPAVIGILIAGLVIASDVYSIILIARNPHSAWRIIVCLIVFILTTACGVAVSWAYYGIIFTSPGFVPRETWQHPPTYVGPPLPPREQSRGNPSNPSPPPPLMQQQQQQQSGAPQLAPSMARRSPNHINDASLPSHGPASPPPAHLSQHTQQQQQQQQSTSSPTTSANPLLDCDDGDTRKNTSGDAAVDPVGAMIYSDSVDSGNGRQQRSSHAEGAAKPAEEMQDAAEVRNVRHSPYATPNGQMSNVAVPLRPSSASPLNPYQVHSIGPSGALRYCHTCKMYKPDGAHHCRVCERCVFNFDHHCPFVNNCVGRNNYKLFIIFLLYAGVGATLSGGLMAVTLFAVDTAEIMSKIGWVAVPAVDVVLGMALFLFYVQHRVLLCNGESTLESIVRSDDTFNGWRQAWSRPRPTAAERAEKKRQKKLKAERHYRTLLGNESPWWRRYLPFPVRTDDTADATVPGNI